MVTAHKRKHHHQEWLMEQAEKERNKVMSSQEMAAVDTATMIPSV